MPFELATSIQRLGAKAEYVKIAGSGHNNLDFHIAFYIGRLAAAEPTAFFHIISKDKGFDPLIQHLKSLKILCARSTTIDDIPLLKSAKKKSPDERAQSIVAKLQAPKATRPRTVKTLENTLATAFQMQLSDAEIADVITAMQKSGFLAITDGKVAYTSAG